MSEGLLKQITEETGLPAEAYFCNHKIKLMLDPESKQIIVDMGNFLNKKRPYWVPVSEQDLSFDKAYQTVDEHKENKWISEKDRSFV